MKFSLTALGLLALPILQIATASEQSTPAAKFRKRCDDITTHSLKIPNATVWFTEVVPAGNNIALPDNHPTCGQPSLVVTKDVCRISLYVATSDRSGISLEAWMPADWNSRFLSTGNSGLSGCIRYGDIDYAASLGFATVGANNGHNGTSGTPFLGNPGVVEDFAYRSVHTGVVVGKQITKAFYRKDFTKSYYLGCSTGGRQGFKSVQDFPEDFDGVVAGAPAIAFNDLASWGGHFYLLTGPPGSKTFVPLNMWSLIHDDILKQCDEIDGYKDGIIEDPRLCHYRPESLICKPGQSPSTCLSADQVQTVKGIFAPLYGENRAFIYPRMQPGSEIIAPPSSGYYNGAPFPYTIDWFRGAIYNNASWDATTIGPKDYSYARKVNPFGIHSFKGDLSAFKNRGGKVLHFHGQADNVISSDISPIYYDHVSRTMGLPSSKLDNFYRFFRISGMGHCEGGPGASFIGQRRSSVASLDPEQNVLTAIVRWVEDGTAPDTILGTAYVAGTGSGSKGQVAFQRRHCRYPYRNVYRGRGNPKSPDSWKCI